MSLINVLSKLVTAGSKDLIHATYRRLRADRLSAADSPSTNGPTGSWREIADQAVVEGVLSPGEARLLRAVVTWPDACGASGPAFPRPGSAQREDAVRKG